MTHDILAEEREALRAASSPRFTVAASKPPTRLRRKSISLGKKPLAARRGATERGSTEKALSATREIRRECRGVISFRFFRTTRGQGNYRMSCSHRHARAGIIRCDYATTFVRALIPGTSQLFGRSPSRGQEDRNFSRVRRETVGTENCFPANPRRIPTYVPATSATADGELYRFQSGKYSAYRRPATGET